MSWEGIKAKLERVEELADEIERLSADLLAPAAPIRVSAPTPKDEAAMRERISQISVPLRLGILTGEGLYHLRSSLDHLVCDLVRADGNEPDSRSQFPILRDEPVSTKDRRYFDSCVKGITRPEVIAAVRLWQPYLGVHPKEIRTTPLLVLQSLNNFDKHDSLHLHTAVIVRRLEGRASTGAFNLVVDMDDDGDDLRMDRELKPFGTDVPATITKTRKIVAQVVVAHKAETHAPAQLLRHMRWRVREIVRDLGAFIA